MGLRHTEPDACVTIWTNAWYCTHKSLLKDEEKGRHVQWRACLQVLLLSTTVAVYSYLHTAGGILERLLEGDGAVQQADKLRLAGRPQQKRLGAVLQS